MFVCATPYDEVMASARIKISPYEKELSFPEPFEYKPTVFPGDAVKHTSSSLDLFGVVIVSEWSYYLSRDERSGSYVPESIVLCNDGVVLRIQHRFLEKISNE